MWDRDGDCCDGWQAFDDENAARAAMVADLDNGAVSASLCAVIQSTDYEPHPAYDFGDSCDICGADLLEGICTCDPADVAAWPLEEGN